MSTPPLTINTLLDNAVALYADRPLIQGDFSKQPITFKQAKNYSASLLAALHKRGLQAGDRIGVCTPTRWEAMILFWACMSGGMVYVPMDPQSTKKRLQDFIDLSKPDLFVCSAEIPLHRLNTNCEILPFDNNIEFSHDFLNADHTPDHPTPSKFPDVDPNDACVILFTSGTTGLPKGVIHSHHALCINCKAGVNFYNWNKSDIVLCQGDLFTVSGIRCMGIVSLMSGCSYVILSTTVRNSIFALAKAIKHYKCSIVNTIPEFYRLIIAFNSRIDPETFAHTRIFLSGGAELTKEITDQFRLLYNKNILNIYGQTETGGLVIAHPLNTVGFEQNYLGIAVGCTLSCRDGQGEIILDNEEGELFINTPSIMIDYIGKTRHPFVDENGWFATGDMVKIAGDKVYLTGRKADFIKTSLAERVHPREIEQQIELHHNIKEVGVCGIKTETGHEQLVALLTLNDQNEEISTINDLKTMLHESIGGHRVPSHFKTVKELPKGSYGKLTRLKLPELFFHPKFDSK